MTQQLGALQAKLIGGGRRHSRRPTARASARAQGEAPYATFRPGRCHADGETAIRRSRTSMAPKPGDAAAAPAAAGRKPPLSAQAPTTQPQSLRGASRPRSRDALQPGLWRSVAAAIIRRRRAPSASSSTPIRTTSSPATRNTGSARAITCAANTRTRPTPSSRATRHTRASEKAPDSLLKLGMSLAELGQKEAACSTFAELGAKYPGGARRMCATRRRAERTRPVADDGTPCPSPLQRRANCSRPLTRLSAVSRSPSRAGPTVSRCCILPRACAMPRLRAGDHRADGRSRAPRRVRATRRRWSARSLRGLGLSHAILDLGTADTPARGCRQARERALRFDGGVLPRARHSGARHRASARRSGRDVPDAAQARQRARRSGRDPGERAIGRASRSCGRCSMCRRRGSSRRSRAPASTVRRRSEQWRPAIRARAGAGQRGTRWTKLGLTPEALARSARRLRARARGARSSDAKISRDALRDERAGYCTIDREALLAAPQEIALRALAQRHRSCGRRARAFAARQARSVACCARQAHPARRRRSAVAGSSRCSGRLGIFREMRGKGMPEISLRRASGRCGTIASGSSSVQRRRARSRCRALGESGLRERSAARPWLAALPRLAHA